MRKPDPPSEAGLIRLVRLAARLTVTQAAQKAGISKARWSQVENGHERRGGLWYPVSATDGLLARMAEAVGLDAGRLEQAGRADAAAVLREMNRPAAVTDDRPEIVRRHWDDPGVREIWLIQSMPPATKEGLVHALLEQREQGESPARAAG